MRAKQVELLRGGGAVELHLMEQSSSRQTLTIGWAAAAVFFSSLFFLFFFCFLCLFIVFLPSIYINIIMTKFLLSF